MARAYSEYLQQVVGGVLVPVTGVYVQFVNNATGVGYVSGVTDGSGKFTFAVGPPPDIYTVYTSLVNLAPLNAGWVLFGNSNWVVSYTAGDDAALRSGTMTSGPYTANLPGTGGGGQVALTPTPSGVQTGQIWDYGGEVFNAAAFGALPSASAATNATGIQAALTKCGAGQAAFLPPSASSYAISSGLTYPADRVGLISSGLGAILAPTAAVATMVDFTGRQSCELRNIYISQANATSPFKGVLFGPGAFRCHADRVQVFAAAVVAGQLGFAFTADGTNGSFWNTCTDCFTNALDNGYDLTSTGTQGVNDNDFFYCRASGNNRGWAIGGATGLAWANKIIGGSTDGNLVWGIDFGAAAAGNRVRDLYMENSAATGPVRFQAGSRDNRCDVLLNSALGKNTPTDAGTRNLWTPTIVGTAENVERPAEGLWGHIVIKGQIPTLGALQANVTSQSISAVSPSTDSAGIVRIVVSATPVAAGAVVAIVNFARPFPSPPSINLKSGSANISAVDYQASGVTVNGFNIVPQNNMAAVNTYDIHYQAIGLGQ